MANKPREQDQRNFRWSYAIFVLAIIIVTGFFAVSIISLFSGVDVSSLSGNVALISINGIILADEDSASLFETVASSSDIVELIEKAGSNPNIRAILLEINSPGGSAVASEEIAYAIGKTNKTTVAWIREIGTSGAYWVASSADHIVANRVSITGSIGVIASYLEFPGLLDKYNITYQRLVAGKYKDIGSPLKEMTQEEKTIFQQDLDEIRDYFVEEIAKNRDMNKKDVDRLANGLFYLGAQAKEMGLVDELGGKDAAISYIERTEGITAEIVEYEEEESLLDMISKVLGQQSFSIGRGIGSSLFLNSAQPGIRITT